MQQFEYMLLARLQMDCEYYLNNGMWANKHLWAGNPQDQINKMKELYNQLNIKPEWLTMEKILSYEKLMHDTKQ